ncbi:P-loop containing nucleoside triphosphate hydrolase protein, partial [Auriscalpium vulgare]
LPSLSNIRDKTTQVFGKRPCLWQLKAVEGILKGDRDVVCISGTGSGKTLTFWMPLLFRGDGIQLVVSPLKILGKQNVDELAAKGIRAITINAKTATKANFRDIEDGMYRAVVVSPEILMQEGGEFERMWKNSVFTSKIISLVWDEGHCVSTWGGFRPEYKEARRLRYLIPRSIPFFIASATLPTLVLQDVMDILQVQASKCLLIHRSNDRPNISLCVRKMRSAASSYKDLAFLLEGVGPESPPPKFLIFFDDITDSIRAAKYLRKKLPLELRSKIKWFNADMTAAYRERELKNLREGKTWGLFCTDSFGMGVDLPDIELIIQWKATCNLATLWQRFGRGARNPLLTAKVLFLVEPKHFEDEKAKRAEGKAK